MDPGSARGGVELAQKVSLHTPRMAGSNQHHIQTARIRSRIRRLDPGAPFVAIDRIILDFTELREARR